MLTVVLLARLLPFCTTHLEEEDEQDADKEGGRAAKLIFANKEEQCLARADEGGDAGEEEDLRAKAAEAGVGG